MEKNNHPVQWGRLTRSIDDSLIDTIGQVEVTGSKPFSVTIVFPYGISANAPAESTVVTSNMTKSGKSKSGIVSNPENRFRDLKEWEVKVGNFKSKAHTYYTDSGDIQLNPTHEESTDWAVQFSALKTEFNELQSQHNTLVTDYNTLVAALAAHTHMSGAVLVPDNEASMLPSTATSTADIESTKVDKVRMP